MFGCLYRAKIIVIIFILIYNTIIALLLIASLNNLLWYSLRQSKGGYGI
jgi:hypothetical protein